jgi:hypothetical protein
MYSVIPSGWRGPAFGTGSEKEIIFLAIFHPEKQLHQEERPGSTQRCFNHDDMHLKAVHRFFSVTTNRDMGFHKPAIHASGMKWIPLQNSTINSRIFIRHSPLAFSEPAVSGVSQPLFFLRSLYRTGCSPGATHIDTGIGLQTIAARNREGSSLQ